MKRKYRHLFKWPLIGALFLWLIPEGGLAISTVSLDEVIDKAVKNTYDVRIAGLDIEISRAEREETLSLYYPSLNGRWNSEYVRELGNQSAGITYVGDTVFGESTMYRNSFSLNASYGLYDFGTREQKVLAAEKDVEERKTNLALSERDIKLKIVKIYTELLLVSRELEAKKESLALYKELALTKERLYLAGTIPKTDVTDEALKVVRTVDAVENLVLKLKKSLEDLSFYTGEKYESENIIMNDLPDKSGTKAGFAAENLPEFKIYDLEIEKKTAELKIIKNEWFPRFDLYSSYVWYGKDGSNYEQSVNGMESTNYVIGISGTLSFFEGFKTNVRIRRAGLEIERLRLEKEKGIAEAMNRHKKLEETSSALATELRNRQEIVAKAEENLSMVSRLSEQRVVEYGELLNRKIELLNDKWETAKTEITRRSALLELHIFSRATN